MEKKLLLYGGVIAVAAILLIASFYVVFMTGDQDSTGDTDVPADIDKDITTTTSVPVTSGPVGSSGGSMSVSDSSSPLFGLNIEVPQAAADETVNFDISYSNITGITGLPEDASVAGKMIKIETDGSTTWDKYKVFDKLIEVTLPYDSSLVTSDETVRYYTYDEENKILSSAGFISHDSTNNTISFYTRTFSSFIAIKLSLADHEYFGKDFTEDTGFRPKNDGFYFQNWGSYLEPDGICMGMVSFARYYYMNIKESDGTDLYEKYREGDKDEWRDDATAIQLATRAHTAERNVWKQSWSEEVWKYLPKSKDVAISLIHGMVVTGSPQLIAIYEKNAIGAWTGAHAIMTYKYSNGRFDIYDPNFPGTEPGTDARQIPFTYNHGFTRRYSSGTSAGSGTYQYNIFTHFGYKAFHPFNAFDQLYKSAENKFEDDSIFPTVTLTDYYSYGTTGTTPIDTDGDGIRDTPNLRATISGTIKGGHRKINSTLIYISNQKFKTPVDAYGKFSLQVPLFAGKNDLIILATDENTFSNWSGYLRDTIDSSASKSAFTLTLTWEPVYTDVDLHVKEPTEPTDYSGIPARELEPSVNPSYWPSGYPYLTVDDQYGFGYEQYIATENMTLPNYEGHGKSLYGTYKFRVHYKYDTDLDANNTQTVFWTVRLNYLVTVNESDAGAGIYREEKTWIGTLTTADIHLSWTFGPEESPSWSPKYEIEFKQPNPADYGIPPPPQNELPN